MQPMIGGLDDDADGPVALHAQNTGSAEGAVAIRVQVNGIGPLTINYVHP